MLKKVRSGIKYLAQPRQFMYLWAAFAIACLYGAYVTYENRYLVAKWKYEIEAERLELSLDKKVQVDTKTGRKAIDELFNPDEALRKGWIGKTETYLNVCDSATCKIMTGIEPTLEVCNKTITSSREFSKYRVYVCKLKITVENDQPMACDPITWKELSGFCKKLNS